jgi:medium-chain acyl-[acyl-carrier-protein] hydrolase
MKQQDNSKWLEYRQARLNPALRLVCLPFVGADASIFRSWQSALPSWIEVLPVQYPGRGKRFNEPAIRSLETLRERLTEVLIPYLDRPFALFGHSMGGIVAFELARAFDRLSQPAPVTIFVSASKPPHARLRFMGKRPKPIWSLPEEEFIDELKRLNGTPRELLEDPEALKVFSPTIRADFELLETADFQYGATVKSPIVAFCGTHDFLAPAESILLWRDLTTATFEFHLISGDHFFLLRLRKQLLNLLVARLNAWMPVKARAETGATIESETL